MYAFDRDGTVIGGRDFASNNPRKLQRAEDQRINPEVAKFINAKGGVILSNQDGPSRYKPWGKIAAEFAYLMDQIPGLKACFWSMHQSLDGALCHGLIRNRSGEIEFTRSDISLISARSFRKPDTGLAEISFNFGFGLAHYVGDLSGRADYADGRNSDRQFALNAGIEYIDIVDFQENCYVEKL